MDLKGQLDRFKKQQERCQSTLSSINASRAPSGPSRPSSVPAAPSLKPTPPVKFSNDTERLQFINSIRKGPVGAQIKRVIELLFETRQAFTPEQINERCYVDMLSNKAVFDSLRNNPKVYYDGRRFSYKVRLIRYLPLLKSFLQSLSCHRLSTMSKTRISFSRW